MHSMHQHHVCVHTYTITHTTGKNPNARVCPTCWDSRKEFLLSLTSSKGSKKKSKAATATKNKRKAAPQASNKSKAVTASNKKRKAAPQASKNKKKAKPSCLPQTPTKAAKIKRTLTPPVKKVKQNKSDPQKPKYQVTGYYEV